jgi:hypothetical protein
VTEIEHRLAAHIHAIEDAEHAIREAYVGRWVRLPGGAELRVRDAFYNIGEVWLVVVDLDALPVPVREVALIEKITA